MRIVIAGGGIAGLAFAQRAKAVGWDAVVVEKAPGPRTQGYMMDFFGPGYEAAEAMGVLPRLRELSYDVDAVRYLDRNGKCRAKLDYARFERAVDGRLLSIMRPDLERALREQITDGVELRYGHGITGIDNRPDGVRATLSDGSSVDADLLVGADGIHSTVRRLVFGPEERFLRYLGFHTAAYLLDDPQLHREIGHRFCLTDSTGRQLGCYGLRDGSVAVFAVHREADPALPADVRQALREVYGTLGWVASRALAHCPDPSDVYYDQVAQVETPRWSRQRVVLLGDACQAVSLLAGQGASLAMAGAYLLAAKLATAGSVEAGLAEYQRAWQPIVTDRQAAARRGAQWFLPSSGLRLRARRVALRLMTLPGLDRWFGTALIGKSTATLEQLSGRGRDLTAPAITGAAEPLH